MVSKPNELRPLPRDEDLIPPPKKESTEGKSTTGMGRRKRKGKGRGNKRNPCLKKYKDFCIHGTCQYLRHIRAPSCV